MNTEESTSSKSKKFLKIALGVFAVIVILLGTAFILTARKNAKQAEVPVVAPVKKEYTQEEKMQILAHIAQEALKDTTPQTEKVRILQNIAKQAPKTPAVSTADKLRILQELAVKTGQ